MPNAIYRTQSEWEECRRHVRQDAIERRRKEHGDAWESYKDSVKYTASETRPWTKAEIRKSDVEQSIRSAEYDGYRKGQAEGYLLAVENLAPDELQVMLRVFSIGYDDIHPAGISCLRKKIEADGDRKPDQENFCVGCLHTAWQWVARGFVPKDDADWQQGEAPWFGPGYYYCGQEDVVWDPNRADELLKTGPREFSRLPNGHAYDGRPWWVPCQESDEERWKALARAKAETWG